METKLDEIIRLLRSIDRNVKTLVDREEPQGISKEALQQQANEIDKMFDRIMNKK